MRSCCESNDCITDANRCNCRRDGVKADFKIDDVWEVDDADSLMSAEDDEILDVAPAPDFLTILAVRELHFPQQKQEAQFPRQESGAERMTTTHLVICFVVCTVGAGSYFLAKDQKSFLQRSYRNKLFHFQIRLFSAAHDRNFFPNHV